MRYIKRPVTRIIDGDEAINALRTYAEELEISENYPELTEGQRAALARIAGALAASLETKQSREAPTQPLGTFSDQFKKVRNTILGILIETEQEDPHEHSDTPEYRLYNQLQATLIR